jgi:RNA polymerase sigma-70 factor (ECF subfamily)
MRVFRAIEQFELREDATFLSWLWSIANHRMLDELRSHHRQKNEGGYDRLTADLLQQMQGEAGTASQSIARREAVSAVRIAMAGLPEHYRRAIQLRFFERQSIEQIAGEMQRTPGAIRGLLDRAKRELRDGLGRASLYLSSR